MVAFTEKCQKYSHALRLSFGKAMADVPDSRLADDLSALRKCVKTLQAQAANVVRLRYEERQSCQSIAYSTGRSVTWVTSTLNRARKALRQCIDSRLSFFASRHLRDTRSQQVIPFARTCCNSIRSPRIEKTEDC